ncbi:hypothetical protein SAMN02745702_02925 [Desulfobaculum bizertense DSM 18034]|uniref:GpW protein n=2 Tax=Desulfobaculum TaxID=1433996 RepID=A0A1T4X252_9BACT|nr:hypothetical protein SAMN02745702_02925 [Desulfobaculum bizertense DSM 18034]
MLRGIMVWTKEELQEQLTQWKQALLRVSGGKSYTIGSRALTLQDVAEIRTTITFLRDELRALSGESGPIVVVGRVRR